MSYVYESNEDSEDTFKQYEIREGIVFLVDVTPSVVVVNEGTSQLYEILAAINDLMSELIITMPKTGIGIYLYNCTTAKDNKVNVKPINSVPHAYKLFGLADLNIHNMKLLNDFLDDHRNGLIDINKAFIPDDPSKKLSGFDPAVLPKLLTKLMGELNKKSKYNLKKVVWFTSNDNPLLGDEKHKESMWRIINDYSQNYYYIDPIFLDKFDPSLGEKLPFDMSIYQDIFINTNYLNNRKRRAQVDDDDDSDGKKKRNDYLSSNSRGFKDLLYDGLSANSNKFKSTTITKQIRASIFRLKEIKRIVFNCNLILSDGEETGGNLGCTVKGYSIYNHESIRRTKHVYPHLEHLKPIYLDTVLIKESLGDPLELPPKHHKKSQRQREEEASVMKGLELPKEKVIYFNDEQVSFMKSSIFDNRMKENNTESLDDNNDEDDNEMKTNVSLSYAPYLKLLGFRDISNFQPYYNLVPPIFVTADLDNGLRSYSLGGGYSNSFKTFSALYQQCLKLKKFALVFGPYKRNATPCLYGMIPSLLTFPSDLRFPEGFLMVRLPWLEDVRSLPNDYIDQGTAYSSSDNELVGKFKELINHFSMDAIEPKEFPNPALNYFYLIMKYNLLQMDITECDLTVEDKLKEILLNNRQLIMNDDTILDLIKDIKLHLVQELNDMPSLVPSNVKKSKLQVQKTFSTENLSPDEIIQSCFKHQDWKQSTVAMLKSFAKLKSIVVDGKTKQAFIDAISNYLEGGI
ncbi:ATP-dependent DNA helicase II subunit 1 [Scheffersomyces spartinae]|uniref:DNA helicase n=1 Tax=Scheffersomyces spartinae TaxID=45513 RepID=A0A9P7VBV7_9ASCO|nr:ATP-dependent DNA helicase II subunit 1 [Scheffersomyces spartinae]KAG7195042.1 ATP-dependent DNA helicase II subunit 1 [Scheffersomyces spartinae]